MPVSGKIDLSGRVAVVTGAARGMGRAVADTLAREGADVAVSDLLGLDDVAGDVQARGRRCIAVPTDVSNRGDVEAFIARTVDELGRLDILVTCAGIYGEGAMDVDEDDWDRVNNVNLKGTWFALQAAFPHLEASGHGKIVCIGSIAGKVGGLLAGPQYAASKGGIHALVRWVARYGAPRGVYANGIAPGATDTDMIRDYPYKPEYCPLGRFAQPADMAEPALFLASDASNYMTGSVLSVDGGYLMD